MDKYKNTITDSYDNNVTKNSTFINFRQTKQLTAMRKVVG